MVYYYGQYCAERIVLEWLAYWQPCNGVVAVDTEYSEAKAFGMCTQVVAYFPFVCGVALCLMPSDSVVVLDIEQVFSTVVSDVYHVAWMQRESLSDTCCDVDASIAVEGDVGAASIL